MEKNVRILHRADGVAEKRPLAIPENTEKNKFLGFLKYRCLLRLEIKKNARKK